ncbi:MAG: flagellar hook protein FlgE [Christensenellaceae bacterium]|jgi:flagellar hook protein FlgE
MMRSLFSGVTGLRSHQTRMDVIGNNIANVNTIGFKKSVANFADLYSETVSPASAPTAYQGSTNAQQIGLGTSVASIVVKHTPGAAQYTGNTLDLAITGDGYFVMSTPQGNRYTRDGSFGIGTNGMLQNQSGYYVQGYNAVYEQGTIGAAKATDLTGKNTTLFDTFGYSAGVTPPNNNEFVRNTNAGVYTIEVVGNTGNVQNDIKVYRNGLEIPTPTITLNGSATGPFNAVGSSNTLKIDGVGEITFVTQTAPGSVAAGLQDIKSLLSTVEIDITNNDGFINGPTLGNIFADPNLYENVAVTKDGSVVAQIKEAGVYGTPPQAFAKGEKVIIGYVALATFTNAEGLEKQGNNLYIQTPSSGGARINRAGNNGAGTINPGSLEMSNVDLSEEMVNMITTQRGFQANSRIITVSDTLLEELINLKR